MSSSNDKLLFNRNKPQQNHALRLIIIIAGVGVKQDYGGSAAVVDGMETSVHDPDTQEPVKLQSTTTLGKKPN